MSRVPPEVIEVNGRHHVAHDIESVWRELNNPEALEFCIRQCRRVTRISPGNFRAMLRVGIGPVRVPVAADLVVVPESPPRRYRLSCAMSLGPVGSADGFAAVDLGETQAGVVLDYRARIDFRGRLAQFGARFVDDAVERNMKRFFDRFQTWMAGRAGDAAEE